MNSNRRSPVLWAALAVVALLVPAGAVCAQDEQGPAPPDPPARVARLSFLYGSVSFQPAGENDWVTAVLNRPLTSGDNLWVDAGGRAELHVGSTAIRIGQSTGVTLLEVSDRVVQVRVAQGSVIVNARHVDDDDILEVDTPNLAFSVLAPGEYRIDVTPDGTATSTSVFRGQGQVNGGGRAYTVVAGQQARFEGLDSLSYEITPVPERDSFESWSSDRDRREEHSQSANYVSREVTGYEDLDTHGQWSVVASYGPVWTPVGVPYGWAPYRYGHWAWIEPWGWTWVDDQPWGFAPFHYGRWALLGGRWVWIPGPVAVRPVYAPALVVYVGGGPGAGFVVGGRPGVGWFPLGPGEVFVPPYRVSRVYVTNVNITNTRVENERINYVYNSYREPGRHEGQEVIYANRTAPGAVTVVTRETFVSARPVGTNAVAVNRKEIERAPVSQMAAVAPERRSVMGSGAAATVTPPPAVQNRRVMSNRMPAAPPAPFVQRQQELNAHPGQPSVTPAAGGPRNQPSVAVQPIPPAPRNAPPPAAPASPSQPAATPRNQTPPAGQSRSTQPQPAPQPAPPPRVYERVEPPPPAPAPAPANSPAQPPVQPAAQPTPPAQNHPAVQQPQPQPQPQPHPQPQPATQQRPQPQVQQQPQQQQKPAPTKSDKPKDKDKDKDKPGSGKP